VLLSLWTGAGTEFEGGFAGWIDFEEQVEGWRRFLSGLKP